MVRPDKTSQQDLPACTEHAERAARRSADRAWQLLRAVYNTVPGSIKVLDEDLRIIELSDSLVRLYDLNSREDAIGRPCYEICRQCCTPCHDCSVITAICSGERVVRMTTTEEEIAFGGVHKVFINPIKDAEGAILGAVEFVMDVSDLYPSSSEQGGQGNNLADFNLRLQQHVVDRAQQLLQSKTFLSETNRIAKVGGWELDLPQETMIWSDELYRIHGVTHDFKPSRQALLDFYPEPARQSLAEAFRGAVEENLPFDLELPMRSATGVGKWVRIIGRPQAQSTWAQRIVGVVQDITAFRATEERLAERCNLLDGVMQKSQALVVALDAQCRVLEINDYGRNLLNLTENDLLGQPWVELVAPPGLRQELQQKLDDALAGRARDGELEALHLPGLGDMTLRQYYTPLTGANGRVVGLLLMGYNVTESLRQEDQLRQAQKMEAIGQLAGGIAHDFNNLLTVINGNARLLEMNHDKDADPDDLLPQIIEASDRAADLTKKLLGLSRKHSFQRTKMDLHEAIEQAAALLRRCLGSGVELSMNLRAQNSRVLGDGTLLQSALLNLGVNARDAMPDGGKLRIATRNVTRNANEPDFASFALPPGEYIRVDVNDTGTGMDEQTRKRIFEPFFTTKEAGKGTGLGLPSVLGCVCDHQGGLEVLSTPGQGTTFRILLPLLD